MVALRSPALGIAAYSNEDLFHQDALLEATTGAVRHIAEASRDLIPILVIGAPLRLEGKLFNCAIAIYRGRVLGITPKTYLPNYREFYEKRQFTAGRDALMSDVDFLGERLPYETTGANRSPIIRNTRKESSQPVTHTATARVTLE